MDGVGCDVAKALVEGEDVDSFDWVCVGCIGVFNLEKTNLICGDASKHFPVGLMMLQVGDLP